MEIKNLNNGVISLEGEVWKVINHPSIGDYSNYEISNKGRVKSKAGDKERILKGKKSKEGYLYLDLYRNGKPKSFKIHRLLAILYLENPLNLPCVNHKIEGEEGKSMNFVFFKPDGSVDLERTTIEFCDYKYNSNYGTAIERRKETLKTSTAWKEGLIKTHTKQSKQVYQYTTDLQLVNIYPSIKEAERQTGFDDSLIGKCCRYERNRKTAYGYIWSYEPLPNTTNQLTLFPTITKVS